MIDIHILYPLYIIYISHRKSPVALKPSRVANPAVEPVPPCCDRRDAGPVPCNW